MYLVFVPLFVFLNLRFVRPEINPLSSAPTITPAPVSYTFAVISDIHSSYKNLQKALQRIKQDGGEFIIIAGDLTTAGKAQELRKVKEILDESGIPYYAIPGNHDLLSTPIGRKGEGWQEVLEVDYQSFQKGEVKFILINNGDGKIGVDQTQQEWLNQELVDCPKLYCLVFAHMPLNHLTLKHIMGEDSLVVASQAAQLVQEFTRYQVKELFAGHIHYLSTYTLDGLKTTTDGVIKDRPRFLEVTVHQPETKIEEKQIWLE